MPDIKDDQELSDLLTEWFDGSAEKQPTFVLICDVGQGNLNAVCNADGQPFLYYDMGSPISGGLYTEGTPPTLYCFEHSPYFILSHWDEDHYEAGLTLVSRGELRNTKWLAPDQTTHTTGLSKQAKSMRKKLREQGRELYLVKDKSVREGTGDVFTVIRGQARTKGSHGMNNSGLALRIESPLSADSFVVLSGDVEFDPNILAHDCSKKATGITASHHGASINDTKGIPKIAPQVLGSITPRTLAYSFGWGNQYGHPIAPTGIEPYTERGWDDDYRLDTGGSEFNADHPGSRGHLGIWMHGAVTGPADVRARANDDVPKAAIALLASAAAEVTLHTEGVHALAISPGPHVGRIAAAAAYQAALEIGAVTGNQTVAAALRHQYVSQLVSHDDGATWTATQLPVTFKVRLAAYDPLNVAKLYILADNNVLQRSDDGGATWTVVNNAVVLDSLAVYPHQGNVLLGVVGHQITHSQDGGVTWTFMGGPPNVRMIVADPVTVGTLFATTLTQVHGSNDLGKTWGLIGNWPSRRSPLARSVAAPSAFFAYSDNMLGLTMDAGLVWTEQAVEHEIYALHQASGTGTLSALRGASLQHEAETLDSLEGTLEVALNAVDAHDFWHQEADMRQLGTAVAEAVLKAAASLVATITKGSAGYVNTGAKNLKSQARNAAVGAYITAEDAATLTAVKSTIRTDGLDAPIRIAALAVDPTQPITDDQVRDAVAAGVIQGLLSMFGHPESPDRGFHFMATAQRPPAVAKSAVGKIVGIRNDVTVAIAAAAGTLPSVPINPGGTGLDPQIVSDVPKRVTRVAAFTALMAFASGADTVSAASLGAGMAAVLIAAARGAPQLGCHRFPSTCSGGPCSMSIHHFVPQT